jgi:hypothetical protein
LVRIVDMVVIMIVFIAGSMMGSYIGAIMMLGGAAT